MSFETGHQPVTVNLITRIRVLRPLSFDVEPLDIIVEGERLSDLVRRGRDKGEGMERIRRRGTR